MVIANATLYQEQVSQLNEIKSSSLTCAIKYSTISSLADFDLGWGCSRRGWIQYFITVSEPFSDTLVII